MISCGYSPPDSQKLRGIKLQITTLLQAFSQKTGTGRHGKPRKNSNLRGTGMDTLDAAKILIARGGITLREICHRVDSSSAGQELLYNKLVALGYSTRQDALQSGAVNYYTGSPCKHGHTSKRYTSTTACYECQRRQVSKYRPHRDPADRRFTVWSHPADRTAILEYAQILKKMRNNS